MLRLFYEYQRYWPLVIMACLTVIAVMCWAIDGWPFTLVLITGGLTAVGLRDMAAQTAQSLITLRFSTSQR